MTPSTSDEVLIDVERCETFPSLTESNACGTNSNSYGAPPPDDMIYIGDVEDPCGCGVTQKMRRVMGEDTISASSLHGFTKTVILLLEYMTPVEKLDGENVVLCFALEYTKDLSVCSKPSVPSAAFS